MQELEREKRAREAVEAQLADAESRVSSAADQNEDADIRITQVPGGPPLFHSSFFLFPFYTLTVLFHVIFFGIVPYKIPPFFLQMILQK